MKMWSGRFRQPLDPQFEKWQRSFPYDQRLLPLMAAAARGHDCMAVGILRENFPENDQFGAQVSLVKNSTRRLAIVEQTVRNETTRKLKDPSGAWHLPLNTGFYAIDAKLLTKGSLPDYATPPKELLPGLPRSPKNRVCGD